MTRPIHTLSLLFALLLILPPALAQTPAATPPPTAQTQPDKAPILPKPGEVAVGKLVYGNGWRDDCFSSAFLDEVARESKVRVTRELQLVSLADATKLRDFPMLVISGSWGFTLPDEESKNLRDYLTRGGFLLASSHCENPTWNKSFRDAIQKSVPEAKWVRLKMKHKVFRSLFEIEKLRTRQVTDGEVALEGLMIDDRLVCIYSPIGLSDTDSMPSNCCCCGGNELRDARKINANILVYVVTH